MMRNDSGFLIVAGSIAGQLQHLSGEVLHDGSQVDWSTGSDKLGAVALAQQTMDSADWELKTSCAVRKRVLPC